MRSNTIIISHSPDADDAFMFYAMAEGLVKDDNYDFVLKQNDVESLNQLALKGEPDITAVSVHALAYLSEKFAVFRSGASFGGENYGPVLISRNKIEWSKEPRIAVPGRLTSASLALSIYLHDNGLKAQIISIHFDEVQGAVLSGELDAGVIIHEGQLTHLKMGLKAEVNLGEWWWQHYSFPLPLGVNAARKSLGNKTLTSCQAAVRRSIEYGLAHRQQALDYAASFGRGLSRAHLDEFVSMYVNDLTVDMGEQGMNSINTFLRRGADCGLLPGSVSLTFV